MIRHQAAIGQLFLFLLAGCGAAPTEPAALLAKGGGSGESALYRFRFLSGINPSGDGEVASDWFPAAGVPLNTRDPWKSLTVTGVVLQLVNYTHGSWSAGTCATFTSPNPINFINWDVAGTTLSFAGTWSGSITVARTRSGHNMMIAADRVVNGIANPGAGVINTGQSTGNAGVETTDPSGQKGWFRLEFRNAAWKFGQLSSPDGVTFPDGAEVGCANLTLEARKASLITP